MKEYKTSILLYIDQNDKLEKLSNLINEENIDSIIYKSTSKKESFEIIDSNSIDLIVFDLEDEPEQFKIAKEIIKNTNLETSIIFNIDITDIENFLKEELELFNIDYLIKPLSNKVLIHKISLFSQNIEQKKATEYLIDAYDQNVIASKTDDRGIITYCSKAFCEICGYTKNELIGKSHNIVRHPDMSPKIYKDMWTNLKKGNSWKGELKNKTKNGGYYWVDVVITPDFDYKGEIIGFTSIRHDITSKKYIEKITITDHLTKVYNKKFFDESLEKEIYSAKRYNYPLSLLVLDIDYFKKINDTYGHSIGDSVLKEFSQLLKNNTRKSDIISRVGGEEFTIIVSNENIEHVENFANKIKNIIENHRFEKVKNITTSIGICQLSQDDNCNSLFEKADGALYLAKKNGRNQVKRYS